MIYFLSIGSNLGNKAINLKNSIEELANTNKLHIKNISDFIECKAWGYEAQDDFLNAVIKVESELEPIDFLIMCKGIEEKLGREDNFKWGPRIIDIDIIFCINNGQHAVINSENLTIPHKDMHLRYFVLKPLSQIDDEIIHPILNKTVRELLNSIILKEKLKMEVS